MTVVQQSTAAPIDLTDGTGRPDLVVRVAFGADFTTVTLDGRLTAETMPRLDDELELIESLALPKVVVRAARLGLLTWEGAKSLELHAARCRRLGGWLVINGAPAPIGRVLECWDLGHLLEGAPTAPEIPAIQLGPPPRRVATRTISYADSPIIGLGAYQIGVGARGVGAARPVKGRSAVRGGR